MTDFPIQIPFDWDKYERERAERNRRQGRRTYHFPPIGKNPETGKRRCIVCHNDIEGRGICYCGQKCRDRAWLCMSPAGQRYQVFQRDKGVCTYCGIDTEKIRERLERHPGFHRWTATEAQREVYYSLLRRYDISRDIGYSGGHLWEAHHIKAVADGGGGPITLDDLATACWKCHPKLTGELRRKLNRLRRGEKP